LWPFARRRKRTRASETSGEIDPLGTSAVGWQGTLTDSWRGIVLAACGGGGSGGGKLTHESRLASSEWPTEIEPDLAQSRSGSNATGQVERRRRSGRYDGAVWGGWCRYANRDGVAGERVAIERRR